MKYVENTKEYTISNTTAILRLDNSDNDWYDHPGLLGYCSKTGLNRTPKFIPEKHHIAMSKGAAIHSLSRQLRYQWNLIHDISTGEWDTEKLTVPDFFMEDRDDLTLMDHDFPRDLKLTNADGLRKELIRWLEFRISWEKLCPSNKGDISYVARKATYYWLLETYFQHGHYLTTQEVNEFLSKGTGWTANDDNVSIKIVNDSYLIEQSDEVRWFVIRRV